MRPTRLLVLPALSMLLLAACGGDDTATTSTVATTAPADTSDAPTTTTPDSGESTDACALLSPSTIESLVEFEFGEGEWVEDSDPPTNSCSWTNSEQLTTLTVEVRQGIEQTFDGLDAGTGVSIEELDIGASGGRGVRDDAADRLLSVYLPAGADSVVKLTQSPLKIDDEAMLALAESAALAFENLPSAATGSSGTTDVSIPDGLGGVTFEIRSADAGLDLSFEVTADEVLDARNPVTTTVVCAGVDGSDSGILGGIYLVAATDLNRDSGLVTASIESLDEVDGAGTYPSRLSATDSEGRSIDVDGSMVIDAGLRTGTFSGADGAGNDVEASYDCYE